MAKHRFYLPPERWDSHTAVLDGEEAHHCQEVMRCLPGERVSLFDGRGSEAEAEITATAKGSVTLRPGPIHTTPAPGVTITLGQAVPKGKNMELIIQKATELGAARILPLVTERTVVRFDAADGERKRQKWQRVAIEACKQCGQNWIPEILAPAEIGTCARQTRDDLRLVAALSPQARRLKTILAEHPRPVSATILVGPEGDFSPSELDTLLQFGFQALSLGPLVLRSETAAIHALGILSHELMD